MSVDNRIDINDCEDDTVTFTTSGGALGTNVDPGAFFEGAYAATLVMLNAIDKADSTKLEDLKKVLHTEKVATPIGDINFDENGDAIGIGFSMYVVQDGAYVVVK